MKNRLIWGVGIALVALSATAAEAQNICGARSEIAKRLEARYSEKPNGIGITNEGRLIEVFSSNKGSWTMIITRPNGRSCLVTHGQAWRELPLAKNDSAADDGKLAPGS